MRLSDESLNISIDAVEIDAVEIDGVDALFVHALRASVAQVTPPNDTWKRIEQAVQRFPAQVNFDADHLSQASYVKLTELQQVL